MPTTTVRDMWERAMGGDIVALLVTIVVLGLGLWALVEGLSRLMVFAYREWRRGRDQ